MSKIINVQKIIKLLGGPKDLAEKHALLAMDFGWEYLSVNTIHSWIRRNKIQWGRLPELYSIADEMGVDLDIRKYLEGEEGGSKRKKH